MAKEMMIVFLYDTECCQREEDDPVTAVLYFHPTWVSDIQKLSLCGQLMGTSHFLKESFFPAKIISLQSGKFVIKNFGRFVLAVGTDRNVNESLLEHRASLLSSLLKIYHCDIQTIYDQFSNNGQYKNLSEKLYHIFETYLPILQYNGNLFQNIPILKLPKSGNHIFLEAMQTLQSCQQTKGILGGSILYHNKVVASQLSPDLTKKLVLTDPHRIKSTAELIQVDFHVPVGVQLIVIYITSSEYRKLKEESNRAQISFNNNSNVFPFQIKKKLKRDKSLIFSHIPEEEAIDHQPPAKPNLNFNRPTHLPLRFKNMTSKDITESGFNSINFDESDSFPEFIGRTSVVSTPMTENKILHGDILSICVNPNEIMTISPEQKINDNNNLQLFPTQNFSNYIDRPLNSNFRKNSSLNDLQDSLNKTSRKISIRPFGIGLKKIDQSKLYYNYNDNNGNNDDNDDDDIIDDNFFGGYRTITDPTYPVFNSNGKPISKCLFQTFFEKHFDETEKTENGINNNNKFNNFEIEYDTKLINDNSFDIKEITDCEKENEPNIVNYSNKQCQNRKSLTLPIKSLNLEPDNNSKDGIISTVNTTNTTSIFDSPSKRKKLSGIQLTPLMNKLTLLAMNDEKSSGFSSWDATPGVDIPPGVTPIENKSFFKRRQSIKCVEISDDSNKDPLQKIELFVCGQQNMTLFLLLEESSSERQDLVHSMWEVCVSRLTKLETNLHQILNLNVETNEKSEGGYSFVNLDSKWDTLDRGGPWSPNDLSSLEVMHKEFVKNPKLTEMLLRDEDSVVYGYQSGLSEIFYQQPAHSHNGLPPPADPMGTVPLCARRKLERDHSIILL